VGKRTFDVVVAIFALAALWPVLVLVAAIIKLSSPGPALFRQIRVGRQGRSFQLLKFRSMRLAAEDVGPRITRQNDPRVFPVGRILRKWKLDEMPQLINVLRGEMSLVGPRPDLHELWATLDRILAGQENRQLTDYYLTKLYPEKVRLDVEYAKRASLAGDLGILMQTVTAIFVPNQDSKGSLR